MKKTKANASKASQATLAIERARIKAQLQPFSGSALLGRYVAPGFSRGGKTWLVSSK